MKLLDEIIEGAVSDTQPIGTVLRKCLVLERQVKNEKFRIWLDNELDGYDNVDELPDYRTINSISRGFFVGIAGRQINDQPLNLYVMEEKHRKLVDKLRLAQPAASYEGRPDKSADGSQAGSCAPAAGLCVSWQLIADDDPLTAAFSLNDDITVFNFLLHRFAAGIHRATFRANRPAKFA